MKKALTIVATAFLLAACGERGATLMRTFKLTLAYNGTGYAGSQAQDNRPTIQGELEAALQGALDEPRASSSTDSAEEEPAASPDNDRPQHGSPDSPRADPADDPARLRILWLPEASACCVELRLVVPHHLAAATTLQRSPETIDCRPGPLGAATLGYAGAEYFPLPKAQAAPAAAIEEAANKYDAGLIVLSSSGKGLARRIALGSTTDRVMHSVQRPLLIVPIRDES